MITQWTRLGGAQVRRVRVRCPRVQLRTVVALPPHDLRSGCQEHALTRGNYISASSKAFSTISREPIPWIRSLVFVLSHVSGIKRVLQHSPDAIIFDMEDAVPYSHKISHRVKINSILSELEGLFHEAAQHNKSFRRPIVGLRVNSLDSLDLVRADLDSFITNSSSRLIDTLLLPKVGSVDDIRKFDSLVSEAEAASKTPVNWRIRFIPIAETSKAVLQAFEIAAGSDRNIGLIMGHADLLQDLEAADKIPVLQFPRSVVATAARAAGIQPIDSAFLHVRDIVAYEKECMRAKDFGFSGKVVLHPALINMTHRCFSPDKKEVQWAKTILEKEAAVSTGSQVPAAGKHHGIFLVDGAIAGPPAIAKAKKILAHASPYTSNTHEYASPNRRKVVRSLGGLDLSAVHPGQEITSPIQLTLSDAMKHIWMGSFYESSPFITSDLAAKEITGRGAPVPSSLLMALVVGMSVSSFSENAIVHLSFRDMIQHKLVFPGDNLHNRVRIRSVRGSKDATAAIITSEHSVTDSEGAAIYTAVKTTMFPPISGLSPGEVRADPQHSHNAVTAAKVEPGHTWLSAAKHTVTTNLRPKLTLQSDSMIIHRLVKAFGAEENRSLVNLLRLTNSHHINSLRHSPSELLIAGPFSIAGILSSAYLDLGPVLAETVHHIASINKVNADDVISACTYVKNVTPSVIPGLEMVEVVIFGVKNIDPDDLADIELPCALFQDLSADVRPQEFENTCWQHAPELYKRIATRIHATIARRTPK